MYLFDLFLSLLSLEVVVRGGGVRVSGGRGSQQVLGVHLSSLSSRVHCQGPELLGGAARADGKHKPTPSPHDTVKGHARLTAASSFSFMLFIFYAQIVAIGFQTKDKNTSLRALHNRKDLAELIRATRKHVRVDP